MDNLSRFLAYVRVDTQADDTTGKTPSTSKQKNLGRYLVKELLELGLSDAHMDEFGNVYGHLPGSGKRIGVNAHMDTALEVTDKNVKPHLVKNYGGGTIKYANGLEMSPAAFPILKKHIGHDLVITDGNTLLGADDKAGIGIIMSALQYFKDNPKVPHANISVCFTVDEEIGEGPLHFNYEEMDADFAYTLDGADIDVIEFENFNAVAVDITVPGVSIHPGEGKDKLINAVNVMTELLEMIPRKETPFYSSGKEGFYHITSLSGTSEEMKAHIILRDFSDEGIQNRIYVIDAACDIINERYPGLNVTHETKLQYENMRTYVEQQPEAVNRAVAAIGRLGMTPYYGVIRGGTDGATFSKNGLITPNLGTGSYNHHGRFEFLDVQEYEQMIKILVEILKY